MNINIPKNQHITVGLSGGVDSVVLLHLLAQSGVPLSAMHVHHGLSVYANDWADFCAQLCRDWQIPLTIKRVQVQAHTHGIEAAARHARYAAYQHIEGDVLALAHHRDDQVETFLLAALRGAGLRGLSAMATQHVSGSLNIIRPLLHMTRTEIEQYAQQHRLPHITDDSNHNTDFLRNWVRHEWLPPLRAHLPHADLQLLAAVRQLQDELQILNEVAQADEYFIHQNQLFHLTMWRTLSPARRRQQLVLFTKKHGLGTPRPASVMDFERILWQKPQHAIWHLPLGQAVVFRDVLFALSNNWHHQFSWQKPISGCLKNICMANSITWQTAAWGLSPDVLSQTAHLRAVQSNDTLPMKTGRKAIKKIFQEYAVPPFLRPHYPVLLDENGVCLAVVGLAVNQRMAVPNGILPTCEQLTPFLLK